MLRLLRAACKSSVRIFDCLKAFGVSVEKPFPISLVLCAPGAAEMLSLNSHNGLNQGESGSLRNVNWRDNEGLRF